MRYPSIAILNLLAITSLFTPSCSSPTPSSLPNSLTATPIENISIQLFADLEELSRIVDISYCVGTTGIHYPFVCAGRCGEFPNFELVDTFNTGPLMSDSCGYIALEHGRRLDDYDGLRVDGGRIIVAFRGTYSLANTIVDLSTVPQEYVPYPDDPGGNKTESRHDGERGRKLWNWGSDGQSRIFAKRRDEGGKCQNCMVHTGFWTSWENTRPLIIPHLQAAREKYPEYEVHLVGHSLGGAVAALAALELEAAGYKPTVTTFGEPRIGNSGLRDFLDSSFNLPSEHFNTSNTAGVEGRYRRITHVNDPVPLLPLPEWGYRSHAGEIYISKPNLQPSPQDLHPCFGDKDETCIASAEIGESWYDSTTLTPNEEELQILQQRWGIPFPARYRIWQLFFAHRDYFWRLGLCIPGGDPFDWGRGKYDVGRDNNKPRGVDEGKMRKLDL